MEVLACATVGIVLQYASVSSPHVMHLKLTQCCVLIIRIRAEGKPKRQEPSFW